MSDELIARGRALLEQALFLNTTSRYQDLEAELSAIRDGTKAMSISEADSADTGYHDLVYNLAAKKKDVIVVTQAKDHLFGKTVKSITHFFFLRVDQLWRIPAYNLIKTAETVCGTSDGLEYLISTLLGYSVKETADYTAKYYRTNASRQGSTLYFFFAKDQYDRLKSLGFRAMYFIDNREKLICLIDPQKREFGNLEMDKIPELILARAAVNGAYFRTLCGSSEDFTAGGETRTVVINYKGLELLNKSLLTSFQRYEQGAWLT